MGEWPINAGPLSRFRRRNGACPERAAHRHRWRRLVDQTERPSAAALAAAWAVHLFTATGIVLALLALLAVVAGRPEEALFWLAAALVVDGVDGTLARAAKVRDRLPRIDGEVLDLVIDYISYVLIPVLFIWRGAYLPAALVLPLSAAILVSSLYVFARTDMKTNDGYFRGFPALWNIVAFYFFVLAPDPAVCAIVVALFVVMTFAPIHVVHPFRVRDYGWLLPALSLVWAGATVALLLPAISAEAHSILTLLSLGTAIALLGMGLVRTVRGSRPAIQ